MNGRIFTALLVLAIGLVCFVSAPVTSGEHPWDSDVTSGEVGDILGGDEEQVGPDSVITDSNVVQDPTGGPSGTDQQSSFFVQATTQLLLSMMSAF